MNITLKNQEIKKGLDIVKGGIENNSNHLILSYVLIHIKNNILILTTTNLEIEIQTKNQIKEEKEIKFAISLIDLNNILSKLDDVIDITFNISDEKIILTTIKNKFELNTLKNYDFYQLIEDNESFKEFEINTNTLKDIIKKTKFSIANENPQKYLNGLFLEISKNQITTATSDGHRLSIANKTQENNIIETQTAIIPKKTIDEFLKLLNETEDEKIKININEHYIILKNNKTQISSKLIDGEYPNYKQIFPENFDNKILINRKNFEQALKQVEIFTKENKTVQLEFSQNTLYIKTNSEKGSATSNIDIGNFEHNINISFNVSYLIQTLQNLTADSIIFNIDTIDAKVVVLNDENTDNCKYLIMAIKV